MKVYKCKQCGVELLEKDFGSFSELEEALWAHIQLEHRYVFKNLQDLDTPSMIYTCYVEKPDKLKFEPGQPLADSVQEANRTAAIDIFGMEMSDFDALNYREMKLTRNVCFHPARMGDFDLSAVEDLPLNELEHLREEQADRIKVSLVAANAAMDALILERTKLCVYDALIGMTFSMMCARPDEAQPFLSKAMLDTLARMVMTVLSKAHAFALDGDQDSAESVLKWGIGMLEGLKQPEVTGYLDQACSFLNLELAYVYLRKENGAQARKAMKRCMELADRFDGSPNYDARSVRFIDGGEHFFMHIILGRTVRESIEYLVHLFADEPLDALWKEMTGNE